jgi:glycosyltransferase involved in cell wall biosynthesis
LSVTVITKNEAHNIADCLRSVQFATEIVVLDSGSTDQTVNIASDFGAKCSVRSDWAGFGIQKNRALVAANEEWILSLDADERVTPQLQAEILSVLEKPLFDAYSIPRSSSFCGQYIRHSGWSPDRVVRLFRRGCAVFSDDLVHERVVTSSRIGRLTSPMLHESYLDLESVMNKANRYSSDGAQLLLRKGKKGSVGSALLHGFWAFVRTYLLRLGFLDGQMGLVLALYIAQSTYYRYLKLWLLQRKLLD